RLAPRAGTIALESSTGYQTSLRLADALPGWKFVDAAPVTERLRIVKAPEEVALIRRAIGITQSAMTATIGQLVGGVTERAGARRPVPAARQARRWAAYGVPSRRSHRTSGPGKGSRTRRAPRRARRRAGPAGSARPRDRAACGTRPPSDRHPPPPGRRPARPPRRPARDGSLRSSYATAAPPSPSPGPPPPLPARAPGRSATPSSRRPC